MNKVPALVVALVAIASAGCRPNSGWTCAAFCVEEASCTTEGESTVKASFVAGGGSTAAEAYHELGKSCPGWSRNLATTARCVDGKLAVAPAPLAQVCGHN